MCGCQKFFVKDPEDEYEVFPFDVSQGEVRFDSDVDSAEAPKVDDRTESYCEDCAWHGSLQKIRKA
jgi:hypothetical protein